MRMPRFKGPFKGSCMSQYASVKEELVCKENGPEDTYVLRTRIRHFLV